MTGRAHENTAGLAAAVILALTVVTTATAAAQSRPVTGDAPEISRSAGIKGGVVVLWPRIIPRAEAAPSAAVASSLQQYLAGLVRRHLPGKVVDVRPAPERVCRRAGCEAMSVNVLLIRRGGACVLLGLVAMPGQAASTIVPWVGDVQLKQTYANFREPPESQVKVRDFAMCDQLLSQVSAKQAQIVASIKATAAAAAAAGL